MSDQTKIEALEKLVLTFLAVRRDSMREFKGSVSPENGYRIEFDHPPTSGEIATLIQMLKLIETTCPTVRDPITMRQLIDEILRRSTIGEKLDG